MSARWVGLVVLGLALGGSYGEPLRAAEAKDLAGNYVIKGTNPDKTKYENTAKIVFKQGNTVEITYKENQAKTFIGLGKLEGDTLRVTFEQAKGTGRTGKGKYQVKPNGRLVGDYREKDTVWQETWIPK